MTLAENIVKFIFKVGEKIRPLTEEKGGVGGERGASELLLAGATEPGSGGLVGESDWAAEEFKACGSACVSPSKATSEGGFEEKHCRFFKHKPFSSFLGA